MNGVEPIQRLRSARTEGGALNSKVLSSNRIEIDVRENGEIVFRSCESLDAEGIPGCGPNGDSTCRTICDQLWRGKLR